MLGDFLMGERPAKPGDKIDWDKYYGQPKIVAGQPMTILNRSIYRIFLIKVANDEYEVEIPPYVISGFCRLTW